MSKNFKGLLCFRDGKSLRVFCVRAPTDNDVILPVIDFTQLAQHEARDRQDLINNVGPSVVGVMRSVTGSNVMYFSPRFGVFGCHTQSPGQQRGVHECICWFGGFPPVQNGYPSWRPDKKLSYAEKQRVSYAFQCYERSTLLYNVVTFIKIQHYEYCILSFVIKFVRKHLFAYYCFIRVTYVLLTASFQSFQLFLYIVLVLICRVTWPAVRVVAQKTRSMYYYVMRNSNTLDRLVNAVSLLFIECSLFLLTNSVLFCRARLKVRVASF